MALHTLSLFTGGGGLDLGLHIACPDARAVCYVESGIENCEVLAARIKEGSMDDAPIWSDVRTFDGRPWRGRVDCVVGGSPCFAAGTLVLTRNGYLPIERIRVGDVVLTHKGRWRIVIGTKLTKDKPVVRINGGGILPTVCTGDHRYWIRQRGQTWDNQRRSYVRTFTDPDWTPIGEMARLGFTGLPTPAVESTTEWPEFWWLVGRYLADGWLLERKGRKIGRIVICCAYKEALDLQSRINAAGLQATAVAERTVVKFHICNATFYSFLQPFGRYAHGKLLPGFAMCLDQKNSQALLDGWTSGDGSRNERMVRATTVSPALALSMCIVAQRAYGRVATVHADKPRESCVIEGRVCRTLPTYCWQLPDRNRSAFIDESNTAWRLLRSVEDAGVRDVYDLEVEEDHSFIANGAAVHNCQDLSVAGKRAGIGGSRSGLFEEFARIVEEAEPSFVFFENVSGLLSSLTIHHRGDLTGHLDAILNAAEAAPARGKWYLTQHHGRLYRRLLKEHGISALLYVLCRLEALGYRCEAGLFTASECGAPHKRERVFILAHAPRRGRRIGGESPERDGQPDGGIEAVENPARLGRPGLDGQGGGIGRRGVCEAGESVGDAEHQGSSPSRATRISPSETDQSFGSDSAVGDAEQPGCQESGIARRPARTTEAGSGFYGGPERPSGPLADASSGQFPQPWRGSEGRDGFGPAGSDLSAFPPGPGAATEWASILDRWPWLAPAISEEEAECALRQLAPELADMVVHERTDALRMLGNGVFPLAAAAAFRILAQRLGLG